MISNDIICSHCGWRNEATARMCGGCGMPLTTNSNGLITADATPTSLDVQTPVTSDVGATTPATPLPLFDAARQTSNYTAPLQMAPSYSAPVPVAIAPAAPRTARNRLGSMALSVLIALVVLVVLGAIGYSAWGLLIFPGIQSQADAELNTRMDNLITTVIPTHAGSYAIGADAFNRALVAQPQDSGGWLRTLRVQINADDEIVFTYNFLARAGSITTHLEAVNGRLMVYGTVVYDALSAFETGTQVETAINQGFGLLPGSARYTVATTEPGSVLLTIAGNGS